jgi:hypothetical protein
MKWWIRETVIYEVEADTPEEAEAIFLEQGTQGEDVECIGVPEREFQEAE